jgi:hypothetical protein
VHGGPAFDKQINTAWQVNTEHAEKLNGSQYARVLWCFQVRLLSFVNICLLSIAMSSKKRKVLQEMRVFEEMLALRFSLWSCTLFALQGDDQ